MILKDIIEIIEKEYPKNLASEWDNVGLLAGKETNEIKSVLVTLDITPNVVDEAVKMNADLILSHHPLLFGGIKSFREDNEKMNMYVKIIRNNISVYSAHTNMDTAPNGINQRLAELFEFSDIEILEEETGLGRVGNIKEIKLKDFCKIVKEKLNTPNLRVSGNLDNTIKRVAVGSGSCGDYIPLAIKKGADLMITADMKYHIAMDSVDNGISVIDAGHYPTEIIVMDMFENLLKDTGLKIKKSENKDIFYYI